MHVAPTVVERAGTGDLLTRAGNDDYAVSHALSAVLPTFSASLFAIAATVAGTAIVDPRLLLALAVAAPLQVFAVRYYLRTAPPLWAEAMVAHRLSQAARADRVIVMDRGRVIEQGPHEELVARGGQYARLWQAWSTHR